ncbi:hypothetical protein NE237_026854 [Protea cynaroides]|uniref:Phytocyanin domain-containing protein n=1 Tax=Protea cynaroides TaxID=273540 RepID=A0A9Q0GQ36_9MAGN|nr:hypothetical protein NE237_026854 [Protea cynaroides]
MDMGNGLLILLLVAPAVYAVEYTVGGSSGWNLGVNYSTWVSGKTFYVGDKLLFNYGSTHAVDIVSSNDYSNCVTSSPLKSYSNGSNTITLNSTGTMYFICPIAFHCAQEMKLAVAVSATSSTPETPTTPSSSKPPSSTGTPSTTTTMSPSPPSVAAGNLCNINAVVLGLGVFLLYVLMG